MTKKNKYKFKPGDIIFNEDGKSNYPLLKVVEYRESEGGLPDYKLMTPPFKERYIHDYTIIWQMYIDSFYRLANETEITLYS